MPGWIQASNKMACPVCGSTHWCSISEDGTAVTCRRESRGPFGPGRHKIDRSGVECWIHRLNIVSEDHKRALSEWKEANGPSGPLLPLASPEVIDRAYRALLDLMWLRQLHRDDLLFRGLSEARITAEGFGSWPNSFGEGDEMADTVYQEIGDELFGVPGFYEDAETGQPRLCRRGGGWVIPTKDMDGRIVSLRVRMDVPWGKSKYLWVSSSRYGGPGAIVTARLCMPPNDEHSSSDGSHVLITEGEIKSIVAADSLGIPAISIPGVDMSVSAFPILKHLKATEVTVAFDMDLYTNHFVYSAFRKLVAQLDHAGYTVNQLEWE